MDQDAAVVALNQFTPSGDENRDLTVLHELVERIGELKTATKVREALIGIFERHPKADLGSPGPIVHALEEASLDDHVRYFLKNSIVRFQASSAAVLSYRGVESLWKPWLTPS